jgi:hypothetical protein
MRLLYVFSLFGTRARAIYCARLRAGSFCNAERRNGLAGVHLYKTEVCARVCMQGMEGFKQICMWVSNSMPSSSKK